MLDKLKARVQLARKIENTQHKIKKTNHDRNWMRETAETLGVDLDSDYMRYAPLASLSFRPLYLISIISESDNETKLSTQKRKAKDQKIQGMKAELKHLLSQPLLARGVIKNYITSGSVSIVDDLIAGSRASLRLFLERTCTERYPVNDTMVGMKKAEAGSEMTIAKKKKKKTPQAVATVKPEEFEEEWTGIDMAV